MRKTLKNDNLAGRPTARAIAALTLTVSLAAFGCTTNRTPGNGEPLQGAPGAGPGVPTSGVTGGTSSGTGNVNPPMTSSSMRNDSLPTATARSRKLPLSPDEAAAIMAGSNDFRRGVRVLGPVNPGSAGRRYVSDGVVTGQFQNPAMSLNPIVTVNSSVNSAAHVPAVASSGVVTDGGAIVDATTINGAITSNATVAGNTLANGGGTVFAPGTTVTTPTAAGLPLTPGTFAAGPGTTLAATRGGTLATTGASTLTPTTAAGRVPTPTVAGSGAPASPVRVTHDANGRVTVTNANSQQR